MEKKRTIDIHGKEYMPVNQRVLLAHEDKDNITLDIITEIISHAPVLFKATVKTSKGTFVGHSAADPKKTIESKTPYEVAETSAVGRALGFAGYGIIDGIASADEIVKAESIGKVQQEYQDIEGLTENEKYANTTQFTNPYCPACMVEAVTSKTKGTLYCPNFLKHDKTAGRINIVHPKSEKAVQLDAETKKSQEDFMEGLV